MDNNNYLSAPPPPRSLLSNRCSIHDYGQGYRIHTYEFDLIDYEPEQITVLLDNYGRLRIRAYRPPCKEFRREYNLGGATVETRLVRNTIDASGHLCVDVEVRPRQYDLPLINNNNTLTFDLQGYRPKHVNVRVDENGLLKVNAQHTDDTIGHRINREYYRQYQLPKHVNSDQIRAKMDENQQLTVAFTQPLTEGKNSTWQPYYDKRYPLNYKNACCNVM